MAPQLARENVQFKPAGRSQLKGREKVWKGISFASTQILS